jgi:subtilisin family serine protease
MLALALLTLPAAVLWAQESYLFSNGGRRQEYRWDRSQPAVFYEAAELPSREKLAAMSSAARERRLTAARRILTNSLLVKMDAPRYAELRPTGAAGMEKSMLKGWILVRYASPLAALEAAGWMIKSGDWEFAPVFSRRMEKKQILRREVSDPLYPKQWHLAAEGINLGMKDVWDSVTGKGVNMAVVDDGLEVAHEDLSANAHPLDSGYHRNFNDGPANDPSPLKATESHGTACAGLAAASGFNNTGVVGVAPEARLMGLRLIAGNASDEDTGNALAWQPEGLVTHVSSNSWGPSDDGKDLGRVGPLQLAGMEKAVTEYRDGLGTVFLVSCGNGRDSGDDSSYDGFSSSRFAIAVAAVNRDGEQSSYSESGMNVAISAPGGEFNPPGVMWTTNNSGAEAFGIKAEKFPTTEAPVNYTDAFNGTSAAAPQISGTVALMLEKNPKLGYRDVKEILIRTANREGLKGGDEFTANGAGILFSHSFGAGLANVSAAVARSGEWENLGPLVSTEMVSREAGPIADDGKPAVRSFDVNADRPIRIEHVEIVVNVKHPKRGDLAFAITSPSGMVSIASPRPPDEGADFEDYTFTSVRHWGESSAGAWRVAVLDNVKNGSAGEIQSITLRLYGSAIAK